MCSHRGFSPYTEHLRWPPCRRNSPWSGKYSILCGWKFVRQAGAMYYSGYLDMDRYAELSSEGGSPWRARAMTTVVPIFLHKFLGCGRLCFQCWFDRTSVSVDKQNLSGNVMHNKTWKDDVYYYWCQWTRSSSSLHLLLETLAVQDCTFLGVAILDIGDGWNSLFLY